MNFYLFFTFFLLIAFFQLSCIENNTNENDTPSCLQNEQCTDRCNELFKSNEESSSKCLKLTETEVSKIEKTLSAIKTQQWSSIDEHELRALLNINKDLWLEYIHTNRKHAQEMLLWLAENPDIGRQMKDTDEIFRKAFKTLSQTQGNRAFIEGLKTIIDTENNKTFLEICAEKNNDLPFEKVHKILVQECNNSTSCIKSLYCDLNKALVFAKLNKLGLGGEADQDGDSLHSDECT